eukprot:10730781-Lingulodinium_polyedra.AAC.1
MKLLQHPLADGAASLMVGDNLGVARYCAGTGRILEPELHGILDPHLGRLAANGQMNRWIAVRRRYNQAADEAASEGCKMAAEAARSGGVRRLERFELHAGEQ